MKNRFFLLVALAFPVMRVCAQRGDFDDSIFEDTVPTDSIRAIVGDTPITQQEVEHVIAGDVRSIYLQYRGQPAVFNEKLAAFKENGSDYLIRRQVILQEFKKSIKVPESIIDNEVNDEIKRRTHGDNVELTKELERRGMTREQYKKEIRDQFIITAMQEKFIPDPIISPRKVENYYVAHRNDFKLEDQVRLRMIVLGKNSTESPELVEQTRRRATELVAQLKGGASFADLARTYSEGSAAKAGGDTGWEDTSVVNKLLVTELEKLKPGEYSGVIDAPDAFYLVKLEDRHPAHFKPLNEVREQIERTLDSEERDRRAKEWIERLKGKTFIAKF